MIRHLIVAVALQTGLLTYNGLVVVANRLLSRMSTRHGEAKAYRQKMRSAKNYEVCVYVFVCVGLPSNGFWADTICSLCERGYILFWQNGWVIVCLWGRRQRQEWSGTMEKFRRQEAKTSDTQQ